MLLSINDIKKDTVFLWENIPHKAVEVRHKKMARQGATVEVKCRNIVNNTIITRTFFPSDKLEYAEIEKKELIFLYEHRGEYCFVDPENKSDRTKLDKDAIGESAKYLLPNTPVSVEYFDGEALSINLPIKVDMKVIESPPSIKGNTAMGGTKIVVLESGMKLKTPLFINEGDVARVNTQKGEYVERVSKAK